MKQVPIASIKAEIVRFWIALKKLERIAGISLDKFKRDSDLMDIAERNLQIVIGVIVDVGEYLISRVGWEKPRSHKGIALILFKKNVIDDGAHKFLNRSITLRDIIMHYAHLNPGVLYKYAKNYEILGNIMKNILKYMEDNNIDP